MCGTCAGTTATCTSCKAPSKYPIFREYACVDECGKGFYFDIDQLQCFRCHHGCDDCYGPGSTQCYACADNYFNQDGKCTTYCSKGLTQDSTTKVCQRKNSTQCSSTCKTCSLTTSYCLTCDSTKLQSVLDTPKGTCI